MNLSDNKQKKFADMSIRELENSVSNALFKPDPKMLEFANLVMGDTVDLLKVIYRIDDEFKKEDIDLTKNYDKTKRRSDILLTYEEWRAIRHALSICSEYMSKQQNQVNSAIKTIAPFDEIIKCKKTLNGMYEKSTINRASEILD